jgi:hypothetical protein
MTEDELAQLAEDVKAARFYVENPIAPLSVGQWLTLNDGATEHRLSVGQHRETGEFFFRNEFSRHGGDSAANWAGPFQNAAEAELAGGAAASEEIEYIESPLTEFDGRSFDAPKEVDNQLDVSTVQTARLGRPSNQGWTQALMFVMAATVAAGSYWSCGVMNNQALEIAKQNAAVAKQNAAAAYKSSIPVSPSFDKAVERSPALKAAYDSSIQLVAFDDDAQPLYTGSGTLLKNTSVGGEPVVMTVGHMLDYEAVGQKNGFLAAFDHDRHFLGILEPLPGTISNNDQIVDPPVLVAFDQRYPINREIIQKIPGIRLAEQVPAGPMVVKAGGLKPGDYGLIEGDSGSAILIKQGGEYRAIGVQSMVTHPIKGPRVKIRSEIDLPAAEPAGLIGGFQSYAADETNWNIISGLGENGFLKQVKDVTVGQLGSNVTNNLPMADFYCFGYGKGIPKVTTGTVVHNLSTRYDVILANTAADGLNETRTEVYNDAFDQVLQFSSPEQHKNYIIAAMSTGEPHNPAKIADQKPTPAQHVQLRDPDPVEVARLAPKGAGPSL